MPADISSTAALQDRPGSEMAQIDANLADRLDIPSLCSPGFDWLIEQPLPATIMDDTEARVAPVLIGLARQGRWKFFSAFGETLAEQLKTSIKQVTRGGAAGSCGAWGVGGCVANDDVKCMAQLTIGATV